MLDWLRDSVPDVAEPSTGPGSFSRRDLMTAWDVGRVAIATIGRSIVTTIVSGGAEKLTRKKLENGRTLTPANAETQIQFRCRRSVRKWSEIGSRMPMPTPPLELCSFSSAAYALYALAAALPDRPRILRPAATPRLARGMLRDWTFSRTCRSRCRVCSAVSIEYGLVSPRLAIPRCQARPKRRCLPQPVHPLVQPADLHQLVALLQAPGDEALGHDGRLRRQARGLDEAQADAAKVEVVDHAIPDALQPALRRLQQVLAELQAHAAIASQMRGLARQLRHGRDRLGAAVVPKPRADESLQGLRHIFAHGRHDAHPAPTPPVVAQEPRFSRHMRRWGPSLPPPLAQVSPAVDIM
eukprot:scaffold788_cov231-Pinguiococcus_pyrenoidosus.AAC.7